MNIHTIPLRKAASFLCSAAALVAFALATSGGLAAEGPGQSILHQVKETADDGEFPVTTRTKEVDVNARVTISFTKAGGTGKDEPSPRWIVVTNMLAQVEKSMSQRAALMRDAAGINIADTNAVKALNEAISKFNLQMSNLPEEWQMRLGMDDTTFKAITSGSFDGQVARTQPYRNVARWLKREIEQMREEAKKIADAGTVEVTVHAFHTPLGGTARRVHVEHYDNIPAGELQPIEKTGFRLTPAEQRRLGMEIEMAETAKKAIREIQSNSGDIPKVMKGYLSQIRERLGSLEEELSKVLSHWPATLESSEVFITLANLSANGNTGGGKAATEITNALIQFKRDFELASSTLQVVRLFKASIPTGDSGGLGQILLGSQGLLQQLSGFQGSVQILTASLAQWGGRLQTIVTNLPNLGTALSDAQKQALLPAELQSAIRDIHGRFPATIQMIAETVRFMKVGGEDALAASDTLGQTDLSSIWRGIEDLDDGILDLQTVGLAPKDRIGIRVGYRQKSETNSTMKTFPDGDYKFVARPIGFHREFGASLIFARGLRGDDEERQWKPNVAAHVHGFYRYRDGTNGWPRAWNFVNPGLGIHLASLDQGDDSVELGAGVNLSFFDGILTGGAGFNLNNQERPYVFIGLSLLDMLDQAKKLRR